MRDDENKTTPPPADKPKRARQPNKEKDVLVYLKNGTVKPKKVGTFPASTIGEPLEQRLPEFIRNFYKSGDFRVELHGAKGLFEDFFEFSFADNTPERNPNLIEIEPGDDDEPEIDFSNGDGADIQFLLMQQRIKELEARLAQQQTAAQSSMSEQMQFFQLMMQREEAARAREDRAFDRALKLAQTMQPQTQQAKDPLQMLSEIIAVNHGVRELSDEIVPKTESNGSILDGAANLLDSFSRNAPKLAPLALGALNALKPAAPPAQPFAAQQPPAPAAQPQNGAGISLTAMYAAKQSESENE
jgi:organic radical activating enzyme